MFKQVQFTMPLLATILLALVCIPAQASSFLEGRWETDCHYTPIHETYNKTVVTFRGDDLIAISSSYDNSDCEEEDRYLTRKTQLKVERFGWGPLKSGIREVELHMTFNGVFYRPGKHFVKDCNTYQFYSSPHLYVNTTYCAGIAIGQPVYHVIRYDLDDDELSLGSLFTDTNEVFERK